MSNPGVAVKALTITSSSAMGGNTAAKAGDGDATTRWESGRTDAEWIQFDFGTKTQLGYMKLVWENAYGKEYAIQISDDGQTWYQLRYVADGKGGTEEFMNLNANVRYVRMQRREARDPIRIPPCSRWSSNPLAATTRWAARWPPPSRRSPQTATS